VTDKKLVERLANGKSCALDELFDRYGGYVAAVVFSATGSAISKEDRDEVVADVFVSLWKHASSIDTNKALKPWLAVVSRNAAINKTRGCHIPTIPDETILVDVQASTETMILAAEASEVLREVIGSLEKADREIFHRFYFWCQTTATISQDLGMNESTVRSRLLRGREKLRTKLIQRGYAL